MRELTSIELSEISGSGMGELTVSVCLGAIGAGAGAFYGAVNLALFAETLVAICTLGGETLEVCRSNVSSVIKPIGDIFLGSSTALGAGVGLAAGAGIMWVMTK